MLPLSSLLLLQDAKDGQAVHPRVDEAKGHLRRTCLMSEWGAERLVGRLRLLCVDAMLPREAHHNPIEVTSGLLHYGMHPFPGLAFQIDADPLKDTEG